jgi:hypothetical protein
MSLVVRKSRLQKLGGHGPGRGCHSASLIPTFSSAPPISLPIHRTGAPWVDEGCNLSFRPCPEPACLMLGFSPPRIPLSSRYLRRAYSPALLFRKGARDGMTRQHRKCKRRRALTEEMAVEIHVPEMTR